MLLRGGATSRQDYVTDAQGGFVGLFVFPNADTDPTGVTEPFIRIAIT